MGDATIFVSLAAGRMGLPQWPHATGDGDRDPKTWGTTTEEKKTVGRSGQVGIASLPCIASCIGRRASRSDHAVVESHSDSQT